MNTPNNSRQKHLIQTVTVAATESHRQTGHQVGKVHPRTAQESPEVEKRYCSTLNLNTGFGGKGRAMPCPDHFTPYPAHIVQGLGGPQGLSGWVWKVLLLLEYNPWTIQPVVTRYTN